MHMHMTRIHKSSQRTGRMVFLVLFTAKAKGCITFPTTCRRFHSNPFRTPRQYGRLKKDGLRLRCTTGCPTSSPSQSLPWMARTTHGGTACRGRAACASTSGLDLPDQSAVHRSKRATRDAPCRAQRCSSRHMAYGQTPDLDWSSPTKIQQEAVTDPW